MKVLVIPNGFEANYTLGFIRGIQANGIIPLVVSYGEIAPQLSAWGIRHDNLHENQDHRRSLSQKLRGLAVYYKNLIGTAWRNRGLAFHYTGIFRDQKVLWEGVLLALILRSLSGRYYYTVHNVLPHHRENSRLFRLIYRIVYYIPHRLVVHTQGAAEQLQKGFGVSPNKIITISIGLNEEVKAPEVTSDQAREKLTLKGDAFWFLFFGKNEPYKGLDLLLESWREIGSDRIRLAVVGPCPDPVYQAQIQRLIEQLPCPDSVTWREGFVSNEELGIWLAAADVGVLPYRHIYQSGVVFLYLQHGLPILASDVGNLADYVGVAEGRLLPLGDVSAWTETLASLAQNKLRFDRGLIRQSARKYSWEKVCGPLIEDYVRRPSAHSE